MNIVFEDKPKNVIKPLESDYAEKQFMIACDELRRTQNETAAIEFLAKQRYEDEAKAVNAVVVLEDSEPDKMSKEARKRLSKAAATFVRASWNVNSRMMI